MSSNVVCVERQRATDRVCKKADAALRELKATTAILVEPGNDQPLVGGFRQKERSTKKGSQTLGSRQPDVLKVDM